MPSRKRKRSPKLTYASRETDKPGEAKKFRAEQLPTLQAGGCYAAALNSLLCSTSGGRISSTASNRT